ncbi:hypothetical protein FQN57_005451 [Myotisia sp. PD_48]|nr:hypothetical protein FQN57_005451 [Myotisia sp. PD_48]
MSLSNMERHQRKTSMSPPAGFPSHGMELSHIPSSSQNNPFRSKHDTATTSHQQKSQHRHRSSRHRRARSQLDVIDRLDAASGGQYYHHEGPFDAASRERNTSSTRGPIFALKASNAEALRATPRDRILDSLLLHRPLDGVASIPPGGVDSDGRVFRYEEGTNMMVEDRGNFRRWPGMKFTDEDLKKDPYFQRVELDRQRREQRRLDASSGHHGGRKRKGFVNRLRNLSI